MRNRNPKRSNKTTPEKATGQVAPFPYHRAGDTMQQDQKIQADYQERQRKDRIAKDHDLPIQ